MGQDELSINPINGDTKGVEKLHRKTGAIPGIQAEEEQPKKTREAGKPEQQKKDRVDSSTIGKPDEQAPPHSEPGSLEGFRESLTSAVRDFVPGRSHEDLQDMDRVGSTDAGTGQNTVGTGVSRVSKPPTECPQQINAEHPWDNTRYSLEGARNAHRTNTKEEFNAALKHGTEWLESDVRAEISTPGRLETRHDRGQEKGDNLTLQEWLQAGKSTGRGLKLDIKEQELTPQVLDEVEKAGVPDEQLMFNLGSAGIDKYGKTIRERFPDSIMAINPPSGGLTPQNLEKMARQAEEIGGPITFVLREDQVSDKALKALKGHGTVSVWNSPGFTMPGDTSPEERAQKLRERGVGGLIDIRPDKGPLDLLGEGIDKLTSWL